MDNHFGKSAKHLRSTAKATVLRLPVRFYTSNTLTQSSHALRYVMKNRATDQVLLVLVFTLIPKDQPENEAEKQSATDANDDDDLD